MTNTTLTLLAAGSLRSAFLPLVAHFRQHTGLAVDAQFGPAGLLRERIEAGSPCAVFASANAAHPQALLALGSASSLTGMLLAGFVAGLFATGGQSVLYALAPLFYPAAIRATGVGTAVAVGRLGAMSGPLLAGKMLALGTGTVGVMAASAPGIVLAGVAVFWLMHRQQRAAMV